MSYTNALILICMTAILSANEPSSYGWDIPDTPLNLGGYIDTTYDTKREDQFMFNDIAMLLSGHQDHLDIVSEVEVSHITLDGKSNGSRDIDIILERLQLNYSFDKEQTLTVGRFNSHIGYWNQAPINILQDTTTKPHIVTHLFPKATTGLMYQKGFESEKSLSFTLQHNPDIGTHDESILVDRHIGLAYSETMSDELAYTLALGSFRQESGQEATYFGMASQYENDDVILQGELFRQQNDTRYDIPYSGYLQSVWHLANRQDGVIRFERYKDEIMDVQENIFLVGYVYRPWENIVLKGEYIYHTELPLNRFVYSFSVLF